MKLSIVQSVTAGLLLALPTAAQAIWYVDDGNCPGSGALGDPFCSIQAALDAAVAGDTVFVLPGTYHENVVMKAGVDLLGSGATSTTIDAGGNGSTVIGADDAVLDGFLITGAGGLNERAINLVNGSSPVISHNTISGNKTDGIVMLESAAIIIGNTIIGDPSFTGQCPCDPIHVIQSSPTIAGNLIDGTDPNGNLSAIFVSYNNHNMTDSFLIENNDVIGEIELDSVTSNHELSNVIRGNVIRQGLNSFNSGIGIAFSSDAGLIANNTLIGGFGVGAQGTETNATVANNILAFGQSGIEWFAASGTLVVENNDVFGNSTNYSGLPDQTGINGNISADPLFVNAQQDNFRLKRSSPCIDAGGAPADPLVVDQGGTPRVLDGNLDAHMVVDMGAFEFSGVQLQVSGSATPGGQLTFSITGSAELVGLVAVGTAAGASVHAPYGALLFDSGAPYFVLAAPQPLPVAVIAKIPAGIMTPLTLYAQALGLHPSSGLGNFSNRVVLPIE